MNQSRNSIDSALVAVGFTVGNDGVLHAPAASRVKLAPIWQFYELRISLADGNAVVAVMSKSAIKITREGATTTIEPEALVVGQFDYG